MQESQIRMIVLDIAQSQYYSSDDILVIKPN